MTSAHYIPVVPHEAVPEVSKIYLYKNQKKNVPIEIVGDMFDHFALRTTSIRATFCAELLVEWTVIWPNYWTVTCLRYYLTELCDMTELWLDWILRVFSQKPARAVKPHAAVTHTHRLFWSWLFIYWWFSFVYLHHMWFMLYKFQMQFYNHRCFVLNTNTHDIKR